MFASIYAVIGVAMYDTGGISEIWRIADKYGRIQFNKYFQFILNNQNFLNINLNFKNIYSFNIDPTERHSWFSLVIGGMFTYVSLYAINQTQVQRYLTMKDYNTAVKSLWCSLPLLSLLSISTCFSGLAMFSKYYDCDPIKYSTILFNFRRNKYNMDIFWRSGRLSSADQLMPFYVLDTMGNIPGLTGLFVAGIFSSALSSVSPVLNSLAAVTMEDYVKV